MRIHVLLKEDIAKDALAVRFVCQALVDECGMLNAKERRYGIISGDVEENKLEQIRALKHVHSVYIDQMQYASKE